MVQKAPQSRYTRIKKFFRVSLVELNIAEQLELEYDKEADMNMIKKPRPYILCQKKCQMYVYSGHALSYTKLVHRHATQTEGNKYFK